MNKKYIATILLSCLFFTSLAGTFVSAADRPDWAIDPKAEYETLDDAVLHTEYKDSDYSGQTSLTEDVSAWLQVWVSPADCNDSLSDCTAAIGIAYINFSEEIEQDTIDQLREIFNEFGDIQDITDDVPYASLAIIVGSGSSVYGICVYESRKHITSYFYWSEAASSSANDAQTGDINLAADDAATTTKNLMVASGEAAQSALAAIPGYNVFVILGITSVSNS
ncbi:MAG: hypothetical protein ACOC44_16555 [Promethearchaeia archaeon]